MEKGNLKYCFEWLAKNYNTHESWYNFEVSVNDLCANEVEKVLITNQIRYIKLEQQDIYKFVNSLYYILVFDNNNIPALLCNNNGKLKIISKTPIRKLENLQGTSYIILPTSIINTSNFFCYLKSIISFIRIDIKFLFFTSFISNLISLFITCIPLIIFKEIINTWTFHNFITLSIIISLIGLTSILIDRISINRISLAQTKIELLISCNVISKLILEKNEAEVNSSSEVTQYFSELVLFTKDVILLIIHCPKIITIILLSLSIMFYYFDKVAFIYLLSLLLLIVGLLTSSNKLVNYFQRYQTSVLKVNSLLNNIIVNIDRIYSLEDKKPIINLINKQFLDQCNYLLKVIRYTISIENLKSILWLFSTVFFYLYIDNNKINEENISKIVGFLVISRYLILNVDDFVKNFLNIFKLKSIFIKVQKLKILENKSSKSTNSVFFNYQKNSKLKGKISINNLSFSYNNTTKILNNINLEIFPGETVFISGKSGSGKSTIVKLLLGLLTNYEGKILYDNINLNNINQNWLKENIGSVFQNDMLFYGSILQNIVLGRRYSLESINKVIESVNLRYDLNDMPMGLNTLIHNDMLNISGGQKQKILLARALIKSPSILFLDEFTSNIDNINENNLFNLLYTHSATKLIITHKCLKLKEIQKSFILKDGVLVASK